jgi:hypothetical protein
MSISPVGKVIGTQGATAFFSTTFLDINGNVTNPNAAFVIAAYFKSGVSASATTPMAQSSANIWTAQVDTRGYDAGAVHWGLFTGFAPGVGTNLVPIGGQNGIFYLTANNATALVYS